MSWIETLMYLGMIHALIFGINGAETLFSRNNKEEKKKAFLDLVFVHWYMPFIFMALNIDGIFASFKLLFMSWPSNMEDLILSIIFRIAIIFCLIGSVFNILLIKEYLENSKKD